MSDFKSGNCEICGIPYGRNHPKCDGCGILVGPGHLQPSLSNWGKKKVCGYCFETLNSDIWKGKSWKQFEAGISWGTIIRGPLAKILDEKPDMNDWELRELMKSYLMESYAV